MIIASPPAFKPHIAIGAFLAGLLVVLIVVIASLWRELITPLVRRELNRRRTTAA